MVSSQDGARQVIEPRPAVLTPVPLSMPLGLIMTVADHRATGTGRAANPFRPSTVSDQLIAFGIIDQSGQVDYLRRSDSWYRLIDDSRHQINKKPSRNDMICYRTWVRSSHPSPPPPAP